MSLQQSAPLMVALVIGLLTGATIGWLVGRVSIALRVRRARRDAIKQSVATVRGQVSEQLVPLAQAFPYPLKDARFLGAPVDYIVFDGLAAGDRDIEVVFVEVKTGRSQLSARERRVKSAIKSGRVRYEELRL